MTEAPGLSCLGTALRGFSGVQTLRQSAALAGGGVLVDRVLGRDFIQPLRRLAQLCIRLLPVAAGQRRGEVLHLLLELFLAITIARTGFDVLADTLLGGQ